jgi:hypothetical protein
MVEGARGGTGKEDVTKRGVDVLQYVARGDPEHPETGAPKRRIARFVSARPISVTVGFAVHLND